MKRAILTATLFLLPATLFAEPGRPRLSGSSIVGRTTVVVPVGDGNTYVVNNGKGLPTMVQVAPYMPGPTCVPWPTKPFNIGPAPVPAPYTGYSPNVFSGVPGEMITNPFVKVK